ncbi:MAG: DUF4388 domain-containing protein [Acidobacteriota bacterium]
MDEISGPVTISGSLKDVSVSDVLQFIHIGHRSGTLSLEENGERASLQFHAGRLVRATAPKTPRLGEMLTADGRLTQDRIVAAVALQKKPGETRSLGQILVASGAIADDELRSLVGRQISQAVAEVVNWEMGNFAFVVDDKAPADDIGIYPSDVLPDADVDIQMVLLEAARLFDEKDRPPREDLPQASFEMNQTAAAPEAKHLTSLRVQVVSNEPDVALRLRIELVGERFPIETVSADQAGLSALAESPPVVVVDLEHGGSIATLSEIARRSPSASCLALTAATTPVAEVYAAGAMAALPGGDFAAAADWVRRLAISRRPATRSLAPENTDVERLRRVFSELRSGMVSATVALNLMRIISESFERAVLFLVRREQLSAIGAFGYGPENRPLALLTRNMRLALDAAPPFTRALETGEAQRARFAAELLPPDLFKKLNPPKRGDFAVIPVLGVQRPIALVYADHGDLETEGDSIELLELAAAQVGIAFENELLRRQMPVVTSGHGFGSGSGSGSGNS